MNNLYITPKCLAEAEINEKRSRFIATVKSVHSEQEALDFIKEVKKKYYDAKHNVYAYITEDIKRYNDDGEPSKTGGFPVLEMLDAQNITDVVCVVTRYFGGVLLGTGGLVRAYTLAAKSAVEKAGLKHLNLHDELKFITPYHLFDTLKHLAGKYECEFIECDYSDVVTISSACISEKTDELISAVSGTFGPGNITVIKGNKIYR